MCRYSSKCDVWFVGGIGVSVVRQRHCHLMAVRAGRVPLSGEKRRPNVTRTPPASPRAAPTPDTFTCYLDSNVCKYSKLILLGHRTLLASNSSETDIWSTHSVFMIVGSLAQL